MAAVAVPLIAAALPEAGSAPDAPKIWVPDQSGPPVVPQPPIPEHGGVIPPPDMIVVGTAEGTSGYWSVGPGDTFPVGQTTPVVTSADGVTGRFLRFGSPFGAIGGSYLLVK